MSEEPWKAPEGVVLHLTMRQIVRGDRITDDNPDLSGINGMNVRKALFRSKGDPDSGYPYVVKVTLQKDGEDDVYLEADPDSPISVTR